ncbi:MULTISPECIES: lipopolysaccharide biosynthesis protein [unclassified Rhodococcus (in: high G+C Gram-positive bacteria)]|uniref:lipopolysaccharide biosynthesis protein n=1 Tax=unclassified Rhodococcus (in: high G+C Gram-positive bacteria) TaxID=192944 RepID=UPI0002D33875|nr:polysaccharide biosynthesis C-terminal domain-containing protein [Rhodococcus sp. DK17]
MKTGSAAGGVVSSAFAGIALMAAGLLLIPLIIRTVGADAYGVWLTLSVVATYLYYSDLGIGTAIVHFGSQARSSIGGFNPSELLSSGLAWVTAVVLVVAPAYVAGTIWILDSKFDAAGISREDGLVLIGIGTVLLSSMVLKPFESALIGAGYMTYERRNQIAGAGMRIVGTCIACLLMRDIVAVAVAETVALMTPSVLSAFLVVRNRVAYGRVLLVSHRVLRHMFSYSLRAFAMGATGSLILQAGTLITSIVGSPADVTYFNAAFRIYGSVRQIITWVTEPSRSVMSRLWITSTVRAREYLVSYVLVATLGAVLGCLALIVSADSIVRIWLGPEVPVAEISAALIILLLGLLLSSMHIPLIPALDGIGRPGRLLPLQVLWLLLFILIGVPAGYRFGIVGVAFGLSAPLIVLEPLYWRRASVDLDLSFRRWRQEVIAPVCTITAGGALGAVVTKIVGILFQIQIPSFVLGISFLVMAGASALLFQRRFKVDRIAKVMRTGL